MKTGTVPKNVRGDALGIANDRESLEALLEATRRRYEEEGTEEARERYLGVKKALEELGGGV